MSCATCKHWDRDPHAAPGHWLSDDIPSDWYENHSPEVDASRWGLCKAVRRNPSDLPSVRAIVVDASMYRAELDTRDDFGCVLHEAAAS